MRITRREFFKYCTIAAGALGISSSTLLKLETALAKPGAMQVMWLQGASCTGDSTSLLNTIFYSDPVGLLISNSDDSAIDLKFHQTVMNASGTDLPGATDIITTAQGLLAGATFNTYAVWSTETHSNGTESIKMKVENRSSSAFRAMATITPKSPIVVNEFQVGFKYKTAEAQMPFVVLNVHNQDDITATAALTSMYPEKWNGSSWERLTAGATNWQPVTLGNLPYWSDSGSPPPGLPVLTGEPPLYGATAAPLGIWTAGTVYSAGDIVEMVTPIPGLSVWFQCTVAGTSGGAEPGWNLAVGGTTPADGTVTWTTIGIPYSVGDIVMPTTANSHWFQCTVAGSTGGLEPAWLLSNGAAQTDGTIEWRTIWAGSTTVDYAPAWLKWPQVLDKYGTWYVDSVEIRDQGDNIYGGSTVSCTVYVDDIWVGTDSYVDEDPYITLDPGIGAATGFILAIEGSVVTGTPKGSTIPGQYCEVGPMVPGAGADETMLNAFLTYARNAAAVLAIGTCASYGGIPKLGVTGAMGCSDVLKAHGIKTPVINIPGCPAHPDWIVGTIITVLSAGVDAVKVNKNGAPLDYFGQYVCNGNLDVACPWRYNNSSSKPLYDPSMPVGQSKGLAKYKWGSVTAPATYDGTTYATGETFEGCLGVLGCRGRKTKADCAYRKWNAGTTLTPGTLGVNWCVGSRGGCQGCTDPSFPTKSRFYNFV